MNTPVRILADTVKALGIGVSASRDIGGEFQVIDRTDFVHENCARTTSEDNERDTVTENLQEECGEGTVYLAYDYETPFFESTDAGQIRLVKQDHRYIKYYDASGTIAFRFDSVLSHLSILHGAYPDSPCSLKPGQLLPAEHTDEAIRGGVFLRLLKCVSKVRLGPLETKSAG